MNAMTAADISLVLIQKKAGYGLAPRKWRAALKQIRNLPERDEPLRRPRPSGDA
jgi:uncharacterized protein YjeT (DUF2065 family)